MSEAVNGVVAGEVLLPTAIERVDFNQKMEGRIVAGYRVLQGLDKIYASPSATLIGDFPSTSRASRPRASWLQARLALEAAHRSIASQIGDHLDLGCTRVLPHPHRGGGRYGSAAHQILSPFVDDELERCDFFVLNFDVCPSFPDNDEDLNRMLRVVPDVCFPCVQADVPDGYVIRKDDSLRLSWEVRRDWGARCRGEVVLYRVRKSTRYGKSVKRRSRSEVEDSWREQRWKEGRMLPTDFYKLDEALTRLAVVAVPGCNRDYISCGFRIDLVRDWRWRNENKAREPSPSRAAKLSEECRMDSYSISRDLRGVLGAITRLGSWRLVRKTEEYRDVRAQVERLLPLVEAAEQRQGLTGFPVEFRKFARKFGVKVKEPEPQEGAEHDLGG